MTIENKELISVREKLSKANIFVVVPPDMLENKVINDFLETIPKRFVDTRKLNQILSAVVLEDRKDWESINPNIVLLESGDPNETTRVNICISKRNGLILKSLKEDVSFNESDGKYVMTFRGMCVELAEANPFISFLSKSKVVKNIVRSWTSQLAKNQESVLAVGDSAEGIDPKRFEIVTVNESVPSLESLKTRSFSVLRNMTSRARHMTQLENEQTINEVPRNKFVWANNPLIASFRSSASTIVNEQLIAIQSQGISEFDLVTQVMMHLGIYEPRDIWIGNEKIIKEVQELLVEEKGNEASAKFQTAVESKQIKINEDLARIETSRQAQQLIDHFQSLSVKIDGHLVKLPAQHMSKPELNPFSGYEKPEIDTKNKKYLIDLNTGERQMVVVEKLSGKRITFKSVRPEISTLYSLGFSNLHYARDNELAVYGAYLEHDELPFAYSSYTLVERKYSRDMLSYIGCDPDNIIESARAWNCSWAPENTMSVLFTYSHEMLRAQREEEINKGSDKGSLEGIFTSINPNPGFKAVSFRGVRFNVVGMKPTSFSYIRNGAGTADFMSKGEIKKILGITSDIDLLNHPRYMTNVVPFLPTLEMLTVFDYETEKKMLQRPIYRVSNEAFRQG